MTAKTCSRHEQPELHDLFIQSNWLDPFHLWTEAADLANHACPQGYVAILHRSPFVESPMADVASQDTVAVVYGKLKGADDGR